MKARCGNRNGLYVVDYEGIAKCREKYLTPQKKKRDVAVGTV
jgi:hypothetical protein